MPGVPPIEQVGNQLILFAPTLIGALITFIIFWVVSVIVGRIISRVATTAKIDVVVCKLLADSARLIILVIGLITALGTLGINVSALVAGVGLTSLALGLALQHIVGNVVSGMMILIYHPFRLDDTISVSGSEGVVVNIDLRYTTLKSADSKTLLIPNQNVFSNVVVVNREPERVKVEQ